MRTERGWWVLAASLAVLPALSPAAAEDAPVISARLEPAVIGVGELAQLTIEVSSESLAGRSFEPNFQLENLELVGRPTRQEQMSWVNGVVSRTFGYAWPLRGVAPGEGRVYELRVRLEDRELEFPDQTLQVTAEPQRRQRRSGFDRDPFGGLFDEVFRPRDLTSVEDWERPDIRIQATVEPSRPFAGQQVEYTLYVLTERRRPGQGRAQVQTIFPRHLPSFKGFWTQEIALPEQMRPETVEVDDRLYWRQPTLRRALFAYRPGPQEIEGASLDLSTMFVQPSRFGRGLPLGPITVPARTDPVQLDVRALPSPPADFSGAVGHFDLSSRLSSGRITQGEAATLTLEIAGSGQIAGVEDPRLADVAGIKAFPPQGQSRTEVRGERVHSSRSWSYTLVPDRPGPFEIPAIRWTYFDPRQGEFRTLESDVVSLTVAPAPESAPVVAERPASEPPGAPDPAPTPPGADAVSAATSSWSGWLGYGPAAGAAVLVAAVLVLWRRRPRPAHRELLSKLRHAVRQAQPRQAAAECEDAWRDFLHRRWRIAPGQPCSQWPRDLAAAGVADDVAAELVELMDDLHFLRYAPQLAATGEAQEEFWDRSRRVLRRLR